MNRRVRKERGGGESSGTATRAGLEGVGYLLVSVDLSSHILSRNSLMMDEMDSP